MVTQQFGSGSKNPGLLALGSRPGFQVRSHDTRPQDSVEREEEGPALTCDSSFLS